MKLCNTADIEAAMTLLEIRFEGCLEIFAFPSTRFLTPTTN